MPGAGGGNPLVGNATEPSNVKSILQDPNLGWANTLTGDEAIPDIVTCSDDRS